MRTFGRMKDRFLKGPTSADQPVPIRRLDLRPDELGTMIVETEAPLSESFEMTSLRPADVTLDLVVQAIDRYASGTLRILTRRFDDDDKAKVYAGLSEIREIATGKKGWF